MSLNDLTFPVLGRSYLAWAGSGLKSNQQMAVRFQRHAIDIVDAPPGVTRFKERLGEANGDFEIWGRPIACPLSGIVLEAIDGVRDHEKMGPKHCYSYSAMGNAYVIQVAANRFMVFAHLKRHSLRFKAGDKVERGEILGAVGNSGQSTEPHLHFHIQNHPFPGKGSGVRFGFSNMTVNGTAIHKGYEPQRGDWVCSSYCSRNNSHES